jgi:hypothetical protein
VGGASSLGGLLSKMGFSSVSRASANQVAGAFVGDKMRKALEAAHVASQVMAALQVRLPERCAGDCCEQLPRPV